MRKINAITLFALIVAATTMVYGQASRTWVSGVGDDANPCSRTAPCKTFAGAISKTAAGGEIDALDPGGFGALTITKAITLDGGGGQVASVLVAGTNGIVVQAGPNDVVIIRNLRINGIGTGINGIRFLAGLDLNVENCYIFGFTTQGVDIALNQGTQASVHILNSVMKNNGGDGVKATNAISPAVEVGISHSAAILDNNGVEAAAHSHVVISNSVFENGTGAGVLAGDAANSDAILTVDHSDMAFNNNGLQGNAGGFVIAADNRVSFNNTNGSFQNGGQVLSYGTNRINNNGATGTVTAQSPGQQ